MDATKPPIPRASCSVREGAEALGLCENSVWNLLKAGLLTRVKVGRRTLLLVEEVAAFPAKMAALPKAS